MCRVYAGVSNHLFFLLHYFFAFILIYLVMPRLLFRSVSSLSGLNRTAAYYMQMVLFMIILGYLLVASLIWEILSITAVFVLFGIYNKWLKRNSEHREKSVTHWAVSVLDWLEGKRPINLNFRDACALLRGKLGNLMSKYFYGVRASAFWTGFLLIFGVSFYIHFYDAVYHAPPAMSDGYVTLAWMKYIDARDLFHDGIYPQGFHIYLDTLWKFSFIDALYILKYTGPFNALLIAFSLYFSVSRFTGNRTAGLVSAAAYGVFGNIFGLGWVRQVATNSQEFSFIFIFPSLYFFYRYLLEGRKEDLRPAVAGAAVAGLAHTLGYAFLGLGLAALFLAVLASRLAGSLGRIWRAGIWMAGTVALSFAPVGLGLAMNKGFHSSSLDYLINEIHYDLVPFHTHDLIGIVLFVLLLSYGILLRLFRHPAEKTAVYLFASVLGAVSIVLYHYGGYVTQSELIASRASELWGLVFPFGLGIFGSLIFKWMRMMKAAAWMETVVLIAALGIGLYQFPVEPIAPYKMQWDEDVAQYLRIKESYRPKTWMMVNQEEGYPMALGSGFHMQIKDFLEQYDPAAPPLSKFGENRPDTGIPPDIFVYYHKEIFRVSKDNVIYPLEEPKYIAEERDMGRLDRWMEEYARVHGKADIFYDGPKLRIYHFHRVESREEIFKKIWGPTS